MENEMRGLELRLVEGDFVLNGFLVYIIKRDENGNVTHVGKTTMKTVEEGVAVEPARSEVFERGSLQSLFNDLWRYGFRPTDGTGNAGHLGAVEKHLNDMRKLVSKYTETELP
jgi:hypothetical protein